MSSKGRLSQAQRFPGNLPAGLAMALVATLLAGPAALLPTAAAQQKFSLQQPRPDQVFRVESDHTLLERIGHEIGQGGSKAEFPKETASSPSVPLQGCRDLPPELAVRVPYLVCYHPLYFEDKNAERYGLGLGPIQPVVSTGLFYANTLLLPFHMLLMPPWSKDCNAGYFLPGDPVPYKLYLHP